MLLLPILVAAGLSNIPPAVMRGIQLHQLQTQGHSFRAHVPQGELFASQANEDFARRSEAFERCAASALQPLTRTYGSVAVDAGRFELIGSKYRGDGGLRVFVAASPAIAEDLANLARTVEFSCDLDTRGNLRKLDLGKAD